MPAITLEELINAQRDAEDLESVVNGSATLNGTGALTTRLGTTLSTLAKLQASFPPGSTALAAYGSASAPGMSFNGDTNCGIFRAAADVLAFTTAGVERARFGASGGIHIGGTAPLAAVPLRVSGGDVIFDSTASTHAITCTSGVGGTTKTFSQTIFNDGRSIFNHDGSYFEWRLSNTAKFFVGGAGIYPGGDNTLSCGTSGNRFSVVYAGTGTINTSDEREKIWRGGLSEAELRAAQRLLSEIGIFQWTEAITAKGADNARLHVGVRAQRVWAIMAEEGLVAPIGENGRPSGPCPYAFLCYDEWEADERSELREGNRYGVRYDQLQMFMMAALAANILGGSGD